MQATGDTFATRKAIEPVQTAVQQGSPGRNPIRAAPFRAAARNCRAGPRAARSAFASPPPKLARQPYLDLTSRKQQLCPLPVNTGPDQPDAAGSYPCAP